MNEIRIVLVDDHSVVREGLRALLEQQPGLSIVGEAGDGSEGLRVISQVRPDVVLMDMKMPGPSFVDTIRAIKVQHPAVQVMVFTSYAEDAQVLDALSAGATGYLLKDALREDLLRAVREVAAGRAWLHPQAQRQMLEWMRRSPSPIEQLTTREQSVLRLLAEGLSNKQIASRLSLTEGTIKGYVSQILEKLGAADRMQAALIAHREGFAQDTARP